MKNNVYRTREEYRVALYIDGVSTPYDIFINFEYDRHSATDIVTDIIVKKYEGDKVVSEEIREEVIGAVERWIGKKLR